MEVRQRWLSFSMGKACVIFIFLLPAERLMDSKRRKLSEALAKVPHGSFKKIVKLIGDDDGSRSEGPGSLKGCVHALERSCA